MFQIYEASKAVTSASAIWSDDAGATWQRGERSNRFNGSGKSSESQTVRLPAGGVRMYSRNSAGAISYADSFDNGQTWSAYYLDTELRVRQLHGLLHPRRRLPGRCAGPRVVNLIAASYPRQANTTRRAVRMGSIDARPARSPGSTPTTSSSGRFLYSCLTMDGDKISCVYGQREPKSDGTRM